MNVRIREAQGACAPHHFSETCSLIALLENSEDAKSKRKNTFPAISENPSFKISRESMPSYPVSDLRFGTGTISTLFHHAKCFVISLPKCPSIHVPPTLVMLPTSLGFNIIIFSLLLVYFLLVKLASYP